MEEPTDGRLLPHMAYRDFFTLHAGGSAAASVMSLVMVMSSQSLTQWSRTSIASLSCIGLFFLGRLRAHTMRNVRDGYRFGVATYLVALYGHCALAVAIRLQVSTASAYLPGVVPFYLYNTLIMPAVLGLCGLAHGTQMMTTKWSLLSGAPFAAKVIFMTCSYQRRPELLHYFGGSAEAQQIVVYTFAMVGLVCFSFGVYLARVLIALTGHRQERRRSSLEVAPHGVLYEQLQQLLSERERQLGERDALIERLRCEKERVGYELMMAHASRPRLESGAGSTDETDAELAALELPADLNVAPDAEPDESSKLPARDVALASPRRASPQARRRVARLSTLHEVGQREQPGGSLQPASE